MAKTIADKASKTKTRPYDVAEYLRTPEDIAAYLDAWLTEAPDDPAGIARAGGHCPCQRHEPSGQRCRAQSRKSVQSTQPPRQSELRNCSEGRQSSWSQATRPGSVGWRKMGLGRHKAAPSRLLLC